jgi:hypothetical protein
MDGKYTAISPESYNQAVAAQSMAWYHASDFADLLAILRAVNMTDTASRSAAAEAITGLIQTIPYGIYDVDRYTDFRFGNNSSLYAEAPSPARFFVAAFRDGWAELLLAAYTMLNEPTALSKVTFVLPESPHLGFQYDNLPPQSAWQMLCSCMMTNYTNMVGVFNYISFERVYALQWVIA